MKVLIIAPYFFERHRWMISAYKTALALSDRMEVVVLTAGQPAFEQFFPRLKIYRLKDWFIPDPVNYSIVPGLIPALEKIIRVENPDIFLVNKHMFFTSLSVLWLRLRGKKVVLATDTFPGLNWHPRKIFVRLVMSMYAIIIGWPVLKAANVVILFHEGLIPLAKKLGLQYRIIHNGVDLAKIDSAISVGDLKTLPDQVTVAYIGRMESIKGYDDFLAVAQKLAPQLPHVRFLFVGSYHGKEELVRTVSTPQIFFTGHRDDVSSILKAIDIFVLPSYSEGLPNALMEAMAAGCTCLSSDVGGVKTLIQPEKNGLVFPPGDRAAMSNELKRLITDSTLRLKLGRAAQETIRKGYDWKVIAGDYEQLFQKFITVKE